MNSCPDPVHTVVEKTRRGFLGSLMGLLTSGVTGVLGALAIRGAVGRSLVQSPSRWLPAGRLDDFETDIPTPVTLRITRRDGYLETVDQKVVFVTRPASGEIQVLSSSCPHLGCSVRFDREKQNFLCPCHLGSFNVDGSVASGPSTSALDRLAARVEKARVFVEV